MVKEITSASQITGRFQGMALISAPWALFNRPSVQLGTLKAWLRLQVPEARVVCYHFHLQAAQEIGYGLYRALSERSWLAETLYAALLYPQRRGEIERVYRKEARSSDLARQADFGRVASQLESLTDSFVCSTPWNRFSLVGLSVCQCQLTASLYMIRKIKHKCPDIAVVVGGSTLMGGESRTLLEAFPEIDYFVYGEGERPLTRLICSLKRGAVPAPSLGLVSRFGLPSDDTTTDQIASLDDIPIPDYEEYFRLLAGLPAEKRFFPILPVEASRGCWWGGGATPRRVGCAFCNLNLQWKGYRAKNPERIAMEVDRLTERHRTLSVSFTDNLLPVRQSREAFRRLAGAGKDFSLFAEIRATTRAGDLAMMQKAGMKEVQVGIEALSTRLLGKLNKGTRAIQNLEIMKNCLEDGIANIANLLLYFPGSDEADVAETLHTIEWALPFQPLRCVHFWLGYGSPVYRNSHRYGIRSFFNHPHYGALFPPEIVRETKFMIQAYRGDRMRQRRLWRPVKARVEQWRRDYEEIGRRFRYQPILSFRDGREFLIIRQLRRQGEPLTHRLTGASRKIYLLCRKNRSMKKILQHFPDLRAEQITAFLKMMVDKKLMFAENGRYLSLAVHRLGEADLPGQGK